MYYILSSYTDSRLAGVIVTSYETGDAPYQKRLNNNINNNVIYNGIHKTHIEEKK